MTPTQRAAALRLIEFETLPRRLLDIACRVRVNECLFHDDEFVDDASHALKEAIDLLRELAVEPQGKPVAWWIPKAEQFALAKKDGSRPFAKAWEPLYAAPQQQRKPLSQDDVRAFAKFAGLDWQRGYVVDDIHNRYEDFARAIEKAHGIGETP
mgnify:CR=1 FL=1